LYIYNLVAIIKQGKKMHVQECTVVYQKIHCLYWTSI